MLVVIPFESAGAIPTENLLDWIYSLSDRTQLNSCLLVAGRDVHQEYRIKATLAAEVAFKYVDLVTGEPAISSLASLVAATHKSPWLLLDPNCVPLRKDWLNQIAMAYAEQPKKYIGAYIKTVAVNGVEEILLGRHSVYPVNAADDFLSKVNIFKASTKTPLIQSGKYTGINCVRRDAALFCTDSSGELIRELRKTLNG